MNPQQLAALALVEALSAAGRLSLAQVRRGIDELDWAHTLEVLCAMGFPLAVDGDWVVWSPPPDALCVDRIRRQLMASGRACELATAAMVDSTNTRLLTAAANGDRGPRALLAECQWAGRGRRQRQWHAAFGEAILMSLLVDAGRPIRELPGLAIAVGVTLCSTLHDWGVDDLALKWPNDVLVGGAKLSGILVESAGAPSAAGVVVIGIGMNWSLSPDSRHLIDQATASLAPMLSPALRDRNQIAAALIVALLAMVDRFRKEGLPPFLDAFGRFDALKGQAVQVKAGDTVLNGRVLGIAQDGSLRVEHSGTERCYHSAEVSVRAA